MDPHRPAPDEEDEDWYAAQEPDPEEESGRWPFDDDRSPGQQRGQATREFIESDADLDRRA